MAIPPGFAGALHDGPPVEPRRAASVLLLDRSRPWRVLMMRRPERAAFAPGAYVFPGGGLHSEDLRLVDCDRATAIRELFEEVGILIARGSRGRFARDPDCRRVAAALDAGQTFFAALQECGLTPAPDRLVFLSRWVTPLPIRRRFDTRFYLARLPPGQSVRPQAEEVEAWAWFTPSAALGPGGPTMVHATRRILESVVDAEDASRLIAALRRRRESPPVVPVIKKRADGTVLLEDDAPRLYRASRHRPRQSS